MKFFLNIFVKYGVYQAVFYLTVFCVGCHINTNAPRDSGAEGVDLLIVVDVQNDFVTGAVSAVGALEAVDNINQKLREYADKGDPIFFTMDSHEPQRYLSRQEGRFLPIQHCLGGSHGEALADELNLSGIQYSCIKKSEFGSFVLVDKVKTLKPKRIEMVGVCTDICVIANALLLKTALPEVPITVDARCCAGTTREKHLQALSVMESCQIVVQGKE